MLVEDDNNLREIYEARLVAEGYEIVAAHDGEEALALAVKERPDLIISDVMMPKISGFDMLDILRGTPETRNTKVIMMTALGQAEDRARADKLGADRYLVKSQVTLEDVIKVIQDILSDDGTGANDPAKPTVPAPTIDNTAADQAGPTPVVAAPPEPTTPVEPVVANTPATKDPATLAPAVEPPQPTPAPKPPVTPAPEPEPAEPSTPAPEEPIEAAAAPKSEPKPEPASAVKPPQPKPLPVKDAPAPEPAAKSITVTVESEAEEKKEEKPEVISRPTPKPELTDDVADAPSAPFDSPTPGAPPVDSASGDTQAPTKEEAAKPSPKDSGPALPKIDEPIQTEQEEAKVAEQQIQDFVSSNPTLSSAADEPSTSSTEQEPPSHRKLVLTPTGNATKESVDLDALLAKEGEDASVPAPQTDTVITPAEANDDTPEDTPKVDPSQIAL